MYWRILKHEKPSRGSKCVVAYYNENKKPSFGIYEYYENYWENRNHFTIPCRQSDHWCYVEEIINNIEKKFEDDVKDAIKEYKLFNGL